MNRIALAVIGGTGVYKLADLQDVETREVDTRFGKPSGPVRIGTCSGSASRSWRAMAKAIRCRRTRSTTAPTWPR